jgi:hypothetical protein
MIRLLLLLSIPCLLLFLFFSASPEDTPERLIEQHLWREEVMLVFHSDDHAADYATQLRGLTADSPYVVYDISYMNSVKRQGITLPHMPATRFYEAFHVQPDDFTVIVLRKDGTEAMRSPKPIL